MSSPSDIARPQPVQQAVSLTVIAQDPAVLRAPAEDPARRILTAAVRVPAEHLEPGPRGSRLHVVDYDGATGRLEPPAVLDGDAFAGAADGDLLGRPEFRAQNVYAVAARTLAAFEAALGRRVSWASERPQLFLVPRAMAEANAYYSPEDGAIYFGYVPGASGDVQTCLSHDIVAHETTHALLDGLRSRLAEPGLPDQPAFHEALADIVAMLSVFSLRDVVTRLLDEDGARPLSGAALSERSLAGTPLFTLAEQLGGAGDGRRGGLRRSAEMELSPAWREDPAFREPHRRGEVVVAAVLRALLAIWVRRLEALSRPDGADRDRVAEEGSKAAEHLLRMMIRGIDYLPPVELEFEDVLDAVLTADEVVAPDDDLGYRGALRDTFAGFGIVRRPRVADLTSGPAVPVYDRLRFASLRSERTEVFRFLWENAGVLGLNRAWRTGVESVRPAMRVGPDGLVVGEVVAEYVQSVELTGRDLQGRISLPAGVEPDTQLQLWGGGVVVFDEYGRAKHHLAKPLDDWDRQRRRLEYLAEHHLLDSRGRLGFTLSVPRGQRFAALHMSADDVEAW